MEIFKKGELRKIPGVGEHIGEKIEEILKTGKLKYFDKLKKKVPNYIEEFMKVPGMGPKKAKLLYEKLGISTIKQLENAAKGHKISGLGGMGNKSEEDILRGIELLKKGKGRMLLGHVYPTAEEIVGYLKKLNGVQGVEIAGSLRRMRETVRDIDILVVSSKAENVMGHFVKFPDVMEVLAKGKTKASVVLKGGVQVDVRVVGRDVFGSAMQYFTGSKDHGIALRNIAISKGLKLSEYGVFKGKRVVASKTEEDVYGKLGLSYVEPEMRENRGEIGAGLKGKLPELIEYNDIKGDVHVHSNYSDGVNKIEEMVKGGIKLGYDYICITDHSQSQRIANGLEEKKLLKQISEIDRLNKKFKGIRILKGSEVDIKSDGTLDFPEEILKKLDIVIGSIHSGFKSSNEVMTKRILKGLDNKYINIFAHPTGRLVNRREAYHVDLEKVFEKAREREVFLEINAFPDRSDLNDVNVLRAKEVGVKFSIGTDSHSVNHLQFMKYGIAIARRGWCEKKDILNSFKLDKVLKMVER
jgi:DNA polymerase (family 10)